MDKNRRIVLTILILILMACVLAVIDIGLNMKTVERKTFQIPVPEFGPGVGVIRVYGPISISDRSGNYLGMESGSDAVVKKLSYFEDNSNIKAIVIRINFLCISPCINISVYALEYFTALSRTFAAACVKSFSSIYARGRPFA